MKFTGYDPKLEHADLLFEESQEYYPVCGAGPGIDLPQPRTWMQIENQGSRPSCVGHGETTLGEYIYYLHTRGEVLQFNRMFAWVQAQIQGGQRPSERAGASIHGAVKAMREIGLALESLYPYSNKFASVFPQEIYKDAATRKALYSYELNTVEKVFDFQKSGMGGILWGVPWQFRRNAWHCVTSIGVPIDGKLPVANSWGENDGDDGWHYFDAETTERYLGISGSVAIGVSDLDAPQVRKGFDWTQGGLV